MIRAGLIASLLVAAPALAAGAPGYSDATFDVAWSRFERFYDDDGKSRPLDRAFGPDAEGVVVDALVFQFGGRYTFAPGIEAWVDVPLVRLARAGKIDGLLGDQSLFAESVAVGDISAGARLEVPLDLGEIESGFGAAAMLKTATGNYEDIDAREMPTGGGDYGIGGELFAVVRPMHAEVGGAAGLMVLLPHARDGVDVDRGDLRSARFWAAAPVGSRVKVGAKLLALQREADRADGEPVETLDAGAHPGSLVPESRLLSIEPYVEIVPGPRMRFEAGIGAPSTPWLFVPGETGFPLTGKNILLPALQVRVAFLAGF